VVVTPERDEHLPSPQPGLVELRIAVERLAVAALGVLQRTPRIGSLAALRHQQGCEARRSLRLAHRPPSEGHVGALRKRVTRLAQVGVELAERQPAMEERPDGEVPVVPERGRRCHDPDEPVHASEERGRARAAAQEALPVDGQVPTAALEITPGKLVDLSQGLVGVPAVPFDETKVPDDAVEVLGVLVDLRGRLGQKRAPHRALRAGRVGGA